MEFLYFDNNATTKLDPNVLSSMIPFMQDSYGNASSTQHRLGREASSAIEKSRAIVAAALHAENKEIYFTSGATESINTVLKGVSSAYGIKGKHIITCKTEHKAVLSTCEKLEKNGIEITYLDTNSDGSIDLAHLEKSIRRDTILVCIMAANNETGLLHPLHEIADICTRKDVLFFTDATQYVGKLPLDLRKSKIDILCFSAHKFHGPKGIGVLYIRRKSKPIQIPSLITGGNQEQGLRGGTYAVPQIVGLGEAFLQFGDSLTIAGQRDYFEKCLIENIEEATIHCKRSPRIPNTSNVLIKHVKSTELMAKLPQIALSSGSACVTGSRDPSHVLIAMGIPEQDVYCSSRFSFSKYTTKQEIDFAIPQIKAAVAQIRDSSPIWQMYKEGLI